MPAGAEPPNPASGLGYRPAFWMLGDGREQPSFTGAPGVRYEQDL